MYGILIFSACLAFTSGKSNATNSSSTVYLSVKPTSIIASSSSLISNESKVISSTPLASIFITPSMTMNVSSTLAPSSTVLPTTMTPTKPPPTTTPSPKPPTNYDYSVRDKQGKFCLLAKLEISFNISYFQTRTIHTPPIMTSTQVKIPFPHSSNHGSKCGKDVSALLISWPDTPKYFFEMKFKRKLNDSGWDISQVSLNVTTENNKNFKNATESEIMLQISNGSLLHVYAKSNGSYVCGLTKTYPFDKNGTMSMEHVKLQPFDVHSGKKETFGAETNCEGTPSPKKEPNSNIVPIAVGCALAGLVLIVLIAYIIGRRKSQRGYEKV